ncbi:unnamed protein product [Heterosigma akashiwo]
MYDDATIQQVGPSYSQVIDLCAHALFQPLIVFFEVVRYHQNLKPMEQLMAERYDFATSPAAQLMELEKAAAGGKGQQNNSSLNSLVTSNRRKQKGPSGRSMRKK